MTLPLRKEPDYAPAPEALAPPEPSYLVAERGWRSWLFSRDHKRIAIMFYVLVVTFFFLGGVRVGVGELRGRS